MSGVLCTRQLRVSGLPGVIAGNALGEGGAELVGSGGHEDAGSEELSERCGDAGSGGQNHGDWAGCPFVGGGNGNG
jgi:hypothetical protein